MQIHQSRNNQLGYELLEFRAPLLRKTTKFIMLTFRQETQGWPCCDRVGPLKWLKLKNNTYLQSGTMKTRLSVKTALNYQDGLLLFQLKLFHHVMKLSFKLLP